MLRRNANIADYIFTDNSEIKNEEHLWKDDIHLNNNGLAILAQDFINAINSK